ncbi:MAG: hypothetical protein KKG06_07230 [Bacteroidetes bacterium]|nr:hypothetical protein [Bacteroidota bacterium]MBU1422960.1 hypothetical protein [Bacteroidota bacterium]
MPTLRVRSTNLRFVESWIGRQPFHESTIRIYDTVGRIVDRLSVHYSAFNIH